MCSQYLFLRGTVYPCCTHTVSMQVTDSIGTVRILLVYILPHTVLMQIADHYRYSTNIFMYVSPYTKLI